MNFVDKVAGDKKWKKNLLPAAIVIIVLAIGYIINLITTVVVVVHLMFIWLLVNLVVRIITAKSKKTISPYIVCLVAVIVAGAYFTYAYINAHHVVKTTYTVKTTKTANGNDGRSLTGLKIAQITDAHIGTTFDGNGFGKYTKEIQQQNPDMVVVTGDFVDDETSLEDMVAACKCLGEIECKYGIYYITGNHDPSFFYDRAYTMADLERELENNGVKVLVDQTELVDNAFYVVGRMDRRFASDRKSMKELTESLDESKFMIVLDHQPHDFDAQKKAGADLVICGHTHGGQMLPLGIAGELTGANDKTYGLEKRGNTNYVVSSGISCWGAPFKTGAKAEYVIINVEFK